MDSAKRASFSVPRMKAREDSDDLEGTRTWLAQRYWQVISFSLLGFSLMCYSKHPIYDCYICRY